MPPSKPPRAGLPIWWVVSIVFHVVLLTWLIFFWPVKMIDLAKPSSAANLSPERAKQIMDQVSAKQAENLSATVRDLQTMQQQLAELEARKREEFAKSAADFAKNAPAETEQAQAAAARAQVEALAAQARVDSVITNALQSRTEPELKQLDALQKESSAAQTRATEAQQRALEKLAVSDQRFSKAYESQAEANAAQERASNAQNAARAARDEAKNAKAKDRSSEIANAMQSVKQAEEDFAKASQDLITFSNSLTEAQAAVAQGNTNSPKEAKALASDQKKVASIRQKISNRKSQQEKYASRIPEQKARLEKFQAAAAGLPAAASNEELVRQQTQARELQLAAQQAQARARDVFAAARSLPSPAEAGIAALPNPVASTPVQPKPAGEVEKMDLPKLYDTAVKTEDALTESYRRLRATELAMIRQVPLARAMELTDSAKVERPDLQASLKDTANTESARDAMQNAKAEINAIHQLASSLLAQARAMDRSGSRSVAGVSASSENLQAAISRSQTLDSLAAEDENARAKDLTAAMKQAGKKSGGSAGKKSSSSGSGSSASGSGSGSGAGGGTGTGTGAGGGAGGVSAGGSGGGTGAGGSGGGSGSGASTGFGIADGDGSSASPAVGGSIAAMPGRTVAVRGESARWMFVDSWYILGPFDNPGRANLEKQFPPETIVDRSAIYDGKGSVAVQWEFHQADEAKIVPPFRSYNAGGKRSQEYIIYYAATELSFEAECDLWVAIGSDDFSKVWINDQLIWASGKQSKSWRVDEGLRKVHFNQGVNRILYRVENGHGPTEFSFIVGMP